MLYEVSWLFYALGIAILVSIGGVGIFSFLSIPSSRIRGMALGLSIAVLLAGLFFSYRWGVQKEGIRTFTQQAEETIKQYLAKHKK